MKAQELFHSDGKSAGVWCCGECRIVHRTLDEAERCCAPYKCETCGVETKRFWLKCNPCRRAEDQAKEAATLAKATLVDDDGMPVWCGTRGFQDGWFDCLDSLVEYLAEAIEDDPEEAQENWPKYAFACKRIPFPKLDLDGALEQLEDQMLEGARDQFEGLDELQQAVDAFNEANKDLYTYEPDYTRKIAVPSFNEVQAVNNAESEKGDAYEVTFKTT